MAPHGRLRASPLVLVGALALFGAACGKAEPRPAAGVIGFVELDAQNANGPIPFAKAALACGSDQATFGTELLEVESPAAAKVSQEWGEVVAKDMFITGTVTKFELSTGDLQFTHPFGRDWLPDVMLDPAYARLSQILGAEAPGGTPLGSLHTEVEQGLVPHKGIGITDFLPGFVPQLGDRFAGSGSWIIDCAHDNFQTELHPLKFVAFGHPEGNTTVARTFYNPYRVSELYNPDGRLAADLDNGTRFSDTSTKYFPTYLQAEILRILGVSSPKHFQLEAHILLEANREDTPPWVVCAPEDAGGELGFAYNLTTRTGVSFSTAPDEGTGCVTFRATFGPDYEALEPLRQDCVLAWESINQQAIAATGNPDLDVLGAIEALVPPDFHQQIERNPLVDCYNPLIVKDPGDPGKTTQITVDDTQPYPFYGVVKVFRGD